MIKLIRGLVFFFERVIALRERERERERETEREKCE
jgi:hypothetical protein